MTSAEEHNIFANVNQNVSFLTLSYNPPSASYNVLFRNFLGKEIVRNEARDSFPKGKIVRKYRRIFYSIYDLTNEKQIMNLSDCEI